MPLYNGPKNRLWPNVWKGIGFLLVALVVVPVALGKPWQSQGDRLRRLPPSEWSFATGDMDCVGGGGPFYTYGFVERVPQSTLNACRSETP